MAVTDRRRATGDLGLPCTKGQGNPFLFFIKGCQVTIEEEKQLALTEGLIEPLPLVANDAQVLIAGMPPTFACRVISEGQYQALREVWISVGKEIKR